VCYAQKSHATQQRLCSLFIDNYVSCRLTHDPPFSGHSGALPLTHDPLFSGHGGALPLTHDPLFSGHSGLESTLVMLPRSAPMMLPLPPHSGCLLGSPNCPVSAASAADLGGPLSKTPRLCQVASSKTHTDHRTLPAKFIYVYVRLSLSIVAEF